MGNVQRINFEKPLSETVKGSLNNRIIIHEIDYIPVNTTLFPAGGVCCLGRHVSTHVCHHQGRLLITIIPSCT
jgi:hypothetical protein